MIIGISGYARSGKDTIAGMLIGLHGYERVAFADPIRSLLYEMNPQVNHLSLRSIVDEYGWETAKATPEVRRLLQDLGVGARKIFGPQFWVHEAMKAMLNNPKTDLKYVITDVRFANEADMIKANNGQVWRVERQGVIPVNNHISEHSLDDYSFDAVINNDSDIPSLTGQIQQLLG
jgi:hypothetical protein